MILLVTLAEVLWFLNQNSDQNSWWIPLLSLKRLKYMALRYTYLFFVFQHWSDFCKYIHSCRMQQEFCLNCVLKIRGVQLISQKSSIIQPEFPKVDNSILLDKSADQNSKKHRLPKFKSQILSLFIFGIFQHFVG